MTALTQPRATVSRDGKIIPFAAAGNQTFHQGALIAINAQGFAIPGKTAVGLVAVGAAEESLSTVGMADGTATILVQRDMLFRCINHPGDPVTQALVGRPCFIVDDQTVAATHGGNTRSQAGTVQIIDSAGVWVQI